MWEFIFKLIDKLEIKKLIISIFVGFLLFIILPSNFIINILVKNKIGTKYYSIISFCFYIIFTFILILLISKIYNYICDKISVYNYYQKQSEENKIKEDQQIKIINALELEDKSQLLKIIKNDNKGTFLKFNMSSYLNSLHLNDKLIKIPGSEQSSSYYSCNTYNGKFILEEELFLWFKYLYENKKILQDLN